MSVAALVVSYHTGDVLWECLERAQAQCDAVIVVDNGNPEAVSERLQAMEGITYLRPPGNVGFGWAVNLAAGATDADELLVLNPDAKLANGCVERLIAAREGFARPAVMGARLVDESGTELRGSRRRGLTPWTLLRGVNLHKRALPDRPVEVGAISGAAFLCSAADWERLGGFDPAYFLHVEDVDLCRRAKLMGGSVVFVPDADVVHPGATSDVESWVVETHKAMGFRTYLVTHYPVVGRLLWPAMRLALRVRKARYPVGGGTGKSRHSRS